MPKISTLWVFYIGSCIGEIATLLLQQYGKWQSVWIAVLVIAPAVLLTLYSYRVMHTPAKKKKLPVRRKEKNHVRLVKR